MTTMDICHLQKKQRYHNSGDFNCLLKGGFRGAKGPRPSLLLNKMFDRKCKNVQNSNKIASNSLKMLEIVFQTIQNSTFSRGACSGKDHHRQSTGHPTLRPLLSKIPGSAPVTQEHLGELSFFNKPEMGPIDYIENYIRFIRRSDITEGTQWRTQMESEGSRPHLIKNVILEICSETVENVSRRAFPHICESLKGVAQKIFRATTQAPPPRHY